MRAAWISYARLDAPNGCSALHARDTFTLDTLETIKKAHWTNEAENEFTIFARTFRLRLKADYAAMKDYWLVEELKVSETHHA